MGDGAGRLSGAGSADFGPSRRGVGLGALSAAAMLASTQAKAAGRAPLGVQLYSLGDLTGDRLAAALHGVAEVGYATTELAGYAGHTAQALRAAHDAAGLRCISAHVGIRVGDAAEPGLSGDAGQVAQDMHLLGVRSVIVPSFPAPAELNRQAQRRGVGRRLLCARLPRRDRRSLEATRHGAQHADRALQA